MDRRHRILSLMLVFVFLFAALAPLAGAAAPTADLVQAPQPQQAAVFSFPALAPELAENPLDLGYVILHYHRPGGDYGVPGPDFNTFWGLHLWGDGLAPGEGTEWNAPRPFAGVDSMGVAYVAVKVADPSKPINYIVHKGNDKDTPLDRSFVPNETPHLWIQQGDGANDASQAALWGQTVIHYHRPGGDYDGWGLHLWGDALAPGAGTDWNAPKPPDGFDDYGAFFTIPLADATQPLNFIVHKGDDKDPDGDRGYTPAASYAVWLQSGDAAIYAQAGAATNMATIHYRRADGAYAGWGLHLWGDSAEPDITWGAPLPITGFDDFGAFWQVRLTAAPTQLNYIIHKGDAKDPGPDQALILADKGHEIWQIEGSGVQYNSGPAIPTHILAHKIVGDLSRQQAYWVDADTILWPAANDATAQYELHYDAGAGLALTENGVEGGAMAALTPVADGISAAVAAKFPHLAGLPALKLDPAAAGMVVDILKGQIAVSKTDAEGKLNDATGLQIPGVLDALFPYGGDLGVAWEDDTPVLRLWAPTAQSVTLLLYADADPATPATRLPLYFTPDSGVWTIKGEPGWKGQYYLYEVVVFAPTTGQIETNLVTDPYSFSLAMNSTRSQIVDLADAALAPTGWDALAKPALAAPEDIVIYELHVRDFSANDPSVPAELQGTYKAFTLPNSNGVAHLQALQAAGLTHLHLLPVFDFATIDENKANWQAPDPAVLATFPPDSEQQQAAVTAVENLDGFNWGYDPLHYTVPEGSYATDATGPARIVEFREMVQALNQMGLRVVMDVVYNHTNAAGQAPKSVLDRIVPGYYHRLNAQGQVENSTCCANTASEHAMFEKLMIDSLVTWAKYYKIDAFRFDLMGHHMVANMLRVRQALDGLTLENDGVDGKAIYLYGEGWDFGEVANNARGVNATQRNLAGSGIGTFSDRMRDAVRGAGPFDSGEALKKQGFAAGLFYDPNGSDQGTPDQQRARLLLLSDQIRVGMAGNLATYIFTDRNGDRVSGAAVDYNGQPAGYTADPQEVISYVSKHDNQTLYDIFVYGLPTATSMADRVRVQNVALSTTLLGQGVPFLHAGVDLLRSKSLDRDSYNSGDWFNRLDFTYQANNFGVGLPVAGKNVQNWPVMQPLLADLALQPAPAHIALARDLTQELLQIRASSPLFHLQTAGEVQRRVRFLNTGPDQIPGLIVMALSDMGVPDIDPNYELIVALINANDEAQTFASPFAGQRLALHPVQQASVDDVVKTAAFDRGSGQFSIPARTTALFVSAGLGPDAIVSFPGDYPDAAGLGGNWDPGNANIRGGDANGDGVWTFTTTQIPAGAYQFKATIGGSWDENYGRNGVPGGDNLTFTLAQAGDAVHFYYDSRDNYVFSRPDGILPVVAGDFVSEIGGNDWSPDTLTTWMKDPDGDGVYLFTTETIPPGQWKYKVALNEGWAENYPANDVGFEVPEPGAAVIFSYNRATHEVGHEVQPFTVTPPPVELLVTFPGDYPEPAGLGGNWAPENLATKASDPNGDGVWTFATAAIPAGNYQFKAAVGGSWNENYGRNGAPGGDNLPFTVAADGDTVRFYYDRSDNYVASRPDFILPVLVGDLMSEVGGADWSPDHLRGWMKDPDGDGLYTLTLNLPEGEWQYKVALNESWDENYGAGGAPGGDNIPLRVPAGGERVTFTYNAATHEVSDSLIPTPQPVFCLELPLLADTWVASGAPAANMNAYEAIIARSSGVDNALFQFDRADLPPNAAIVSATLTVTATFQSGQYGKAMFPLNVGPFDPATVTYHSSPDYYNPGEPQPLPNALGKLDFDVIEQVRAWDRAGAPAHTYGYLALGMSGPWGRVAMPSLEAWPYTQHARLTVCGIADETLPTFAEIAQVQAPARNPAQDEIFYFLLPDRFSDGDPANNYGADVAGGDLDADVLRHGYRPTDKSFYHGGDLTGLTGKLDYLQGLGVTALWITPPFVNQPTQADSTTPLGVGGAYHGYWILDYLDVDPHLGTLADLNALRDAAQARGMKIFFDIVVNHTADVIDYAEGQYSYRNKTAFPYRDAAGVAFDDRDFVGQANFPPLDAATSFPYTPIFTDPADAARKNPAWLNNPIYYHNRGSTTFTGEDSDYGDFFGMDDLFTEHPAVVQGFINIFKHWIDWGVDGFRLDTAKHVNIGFWAQVAPEVLAYAHGQGKNDFTMFGEVLGGDAAYRAHYTRAGQLPALLDFGLHGAAIGFAASSQPTDGLAALFASDDRFIDPDSNAAASGLFVSNHDAGRLGRDILNANPAAGDGEWLARSRLGHALITFVRGFPIFYYGDEQGFTGDGGDKDAREDMLPGQVAIYNDNDLIGSAASTADDNFDPTHPLYQALAEFAAVRGQHVALRRGAQIHRFSEAGAGIYAFSRIDRAEKVEYLVALNNATTAKMATFATATAGAAFAPLFPAAAPALTSDAAGMLTVSVPGLDFVIYRAAQPVTNLGAAPAAQFTSPAPTVHGEIEVAVNLAPAAFAEVTFLVQVDGGPAQFLGVDDNPPYRVYYDTGGLANGSTLTFTALAHDLYGHYRKAVTTTVVTLPAAWTVIHYQRPAGDYDDWGLHLWGDGLAAGVGTDWNAPMMWNGEDAFGRFAFFKVQDPTQAVGFIVHKGDDKDADADRFFLPADQPHIWIKQGDPALYDSAAAAQAAVTLHYHRPGGDYDGWGLHLWGDALAPGAGTDWNAPKPPDGFDDFGAFFVVPLADANAMLNFIVHKGDDKDTPNDRGFIPAQTGDVWLKQDDAAVYAQRGGAENFALLHYHRPGGDYDGWGLHLWGDTTESVSWGAPLLPIAFDAFGAVFKVGLTPGANSIGYIFHKADEKDPGPDQFLTFAADGYEVWQLQGADPAAPFLIP